MTNDINILLEEERRSIYCMFLNIRGRIIFDSLLSRGFTEDQFLLEVDSSIAATVRKHLMMYKVRRKVKVDQMKDAFSVFVTSKTIWKTKTLIFLPRHLYLAPRTAAITQNKLYLSKPSAALGILPS